MINDPSEHIERAHEYKGRAAGYRVPPDQDIKFNIEMANVELGIAIAMTLSRIAIELAEINKKLGSGKKSDLGPFGTLRT